MDKTKASFRYFASILLVGALILVVLLFHSGFEVRVTQTLVGPPEEKAVTLLDRRRPLEEIQKAVAESGKGVDDIRSWGSLLYCAADNQRMDVAEWLLAKGANPNGIDPAHSRSPRGSHWSDTGVPLEAAIHRRDLPMARLLLKIGGGPQWRLEWQCFAPRIGNL